MGFSHDADHMFYVRFAYISLRIHSLETHFTEIFQGTIFYMYMESIIEVSFSLVFERTSQHFLTNW